MLRRIRRHRFLFLLILFLASGIGEAVTAQDLDARSPKKAVSRGKQRKAEKVKEKNQKLLEKAIKKGRKRHNKLQKKNTKKMMRKSKRKSTNFNKDRKEFFLKRWFRKKQH